MGKKTKRSVPITFESGEEVAEEATEAAATVEDSHMVKRRRLQHGNTVNMEVDKELAREIEELKREGEEMRGEDEEEKELKQIMPRGYRMFQKMGYSKKTQEETGSSIERETKSYRRYQSGQNKTRELQKLWHDLQKIAFEMTEDYKIYKPGDDPRDYNILWRGYIKVLNQASRRSRKVRQTEGGNNSESRTTEESEENDDTTTIAHEDPELELFDEMSIEERIMKLNIFLRTEKYYCFFCGVKYSDERDLYEHCPGIKKEDHE